MRELRQLGVNHRPTLLLQTGTNLEQLGGPVSSAAALTTALDQDFARS